MEQYFDIFNYLPFPFLEQDLSEIKKHVDSIHTRSNKINFKKYYENHPEDVISLAKKVKIVNVNTAALSFFQGYTLEEFNKKFNLIFDKASYNTFKKKLIELSEGKTEFHTEGVTLTFRGEEKHVLLKLTVPPDYKDTLSKVFVTVVDITNLRFNEEKIRESAVKYRDIFKKVNEAILMADIKTGIILEANKKAEELFEIPANAIIGMHYTQLHPKEEADQYKEIFQDHINKHDKFVLENIAVSHKKYKKIPVSISTSVIELKGEKFFLNIYRKMDNQEMGSEYAMNSSSQNDFFTNNISDILTQREREISQLIASGFTNRQIAEKLYISKKTVETHRMRIMRKLDIHKTADIVRYVITNGHVEKKYLNCNK